MTTSSPILSSNVNILELPVEVFEHVFSLLSADDQALLNCQMTCKDWRDFFLTRPVYRKKCQLLKKQFPKITSTLRRFKLFSDDDKPLDHSGLEFKELYFKLKQILKKGWTVSKNVPSVQVLNCMEIQGKNLEVSDEWRRKYNYSGVYDMIWDGTTSLLTISIFNWIQIWDVRTLKCVNMFDSETLDSKDMNTRCFSVHKNFLICGTDRGSIRVFNLMTCDELESVRQGYQYICDIKVVGGCLLALNWYGDFEEWSLEETTGKLKFCREFRPPFRHLKQSLVQSYNSRYSERLLDFNEQIVVSNSIHLLTVFSRFDEDASELCVNITGRRILCLKLFGRTCFWGEQGGVVYRAELGRDRWRYVDNREESLEKIVTVSEDNITSIAVSNDRIVIGDVNGEIHVCALERFGKNEGCHPDFVIDAGHEFGSFIWCVSMDFSRIFSGDSDGKLVIHDFWNHDKVLHDFGVS